MGVAELSRARDLLRAADGSDAAVETMAADIVRAMHEIVTFSACALMTTDPDTILPSGGVVEGFPPEACAPFWDNELLDPDFNKFNVVARSTDPVVTLADAVDGDLRRSPRYCKVYEPLGIGDELRVVFAAGGSCLAVGTFVRDLADGPFGPEELSDVRQLVPLATAALRRSLGRLAQHISSAAPAVILLDGDNEIVHLSVGAQQVIDSIAVDIDGSDLPTLLRAAATRARWGRSSTTLATRLRSRDGRWMRVHVAPMEGDAGTVAITIEPAHPNDLVPILLDSYRFTPRETEIVVGLARGLSTKEISAELCLSPHTVRDHLKAVYEKAGVSSRGELVAGLYSTHVMEHFHSAVTALDP